MQAQLSTQLLTVSPQIRGKLLKNAIHDYQDQGFVLVVQEQYRALLKRQVKVIEGSTTRYISLEGNQLYLYVDTTGELLTTKG